MLSQSLRQQRWTQFFAFWYWVKPRNDRTRTSEQKVIAPATIIQGTAIYTVLLPVISTHATVGRNVPQRPFRGFNCE